MKTTNSIGHVFTLPLLLVPGSYGTNTNAGSGIKSIHYTFSNNAAQYLCPL